MKRHRLVPGYWLGAFALVVSACGTSPSGVAPKTEAAPPLQAPTGGGAGVGLPAPVITIAKALGARSTAFSLLAGQDGLIALASEGTATRVRLAASSTDAGYALASVDTAPQAPAPATFFPFTFGEVSAAPRRSAVSATPDRTTRALVGLDARMRARDRAFDGTTRKPSYKLKAQADVREGATETFWVIAREEGDRLVERQVSARAVRVGSHSIVWLDTRLGTNLDAQARTIGERFDADIWPTDTRLFGEPVAGDRDPRVSILVSPEVGDHGRDLTIGYFSARDLFSLQDDPAAEALARSNDRLMLYVSSTVVARGAQADWLGTLAHELQHLISATHKLFGAAAAQRQEDLWLNEALSMYAMQANGLGPASGAHVVTDHVAAYLAAPQSYPLVDWTQAPGGSAYGAGYLFALYLAEQAGEGVLKDLVASREVGIANVDARLVGSGRTFGSLFKDWVAATALDGSGRPADPVHQYKGIDLHGTYGGAELTGPSLAELELPVAVATRLPPWSAAFIRLAPGPAGQWDLQLSGAAGWLWAP